MCHSTFFQLGNHLDPEAYGPQMVAVNNNPTHRQRWYKLHKTIIEFKEHSGAHVILEVLLNGMEPRVLSTLDLGGVKCFLEVTANEPLLCKVNDVLFLITTGTWF